MMKTIQIIKDEIKAYIDEKELNITSGFIKDKEELKILISLSGDNQLGLFKFLKFLSDNNYLQHINFRNLPENIKIQ